MASTVFGRSTQCVLNMHCAAAAVCPKLKLCCSDLDDPSFANMLFMAPSGGFQRTTCISGFLLQHMMNQLV